MTSLEKCPLKKFQRRDAHFQSEAVGDIVKILHAQRKRYRDFSEFLVFRDGLWYFHDIKSLFDAVSILCRL